MQRGTFCPELRAERWRTAGAEVLQSPLFRTVDDVPRGKGSGIHGHSGNPRRLHLAGNSRGKLQSTPVLVPVFSPSFFASHNCGQEVQAFLERIQLYASSNPRPAVTPRCILPVTWVWPNLTVHPALKDFQYQDVSYPQKYLDKIVGLRMLVELKHKRDQFLTFSNRLAVAINDALLAQARAACHLVRRTTANCLMPLRPPMLRRWCQGRSL